MTVACDEPGGHRLVPGPRCLVSQGILHRFESETPGRLLGLTYGKGTGRRPV